MSMGALPRCGKIGRRYREPCQRRKGHTGSCDYRALEPHVHDFVSGLADYQRRFQEDSDSYGAEKAYWIRQLFPASDDCYFGLTCEACKSEVGALSEQCRVEVDHVIRQFLEKKDADGEADLTILSCEVGRIRGYWRGRAAAILRLAMLEKVTW